MLGRRFTVVQVNMSAGKRPLVLHLNFSLFSYYACRTLMHLIINQLSLYFNKGFCCNIFCQSKFQNFRNKFNWLNLNFYYAVVCINNSSIACHHCVCNIIKRKTVYVKFYFVLTSEWKRYSVFIFMIDKKKKAVQPCIMNLRDKLAKLELYWRIIDINNWQNNCCEIVQVNAYTFSK